jgi:hypothetical protein
MTKDEFQRQYHYYQTHDEKEAKAEARRVNEEGIDNDIAVAVKLGDLGWCLMLKTAADFVREMDII